MKRMMVAIMVGLCLLPALSGLADTAPPGIPEGTLAPLEIRLPGGKKLPVHTGPGDEYPLAGNGRAAVSTNGWVQVFGREGDWLLIQYGISEGRMRFGYIPMRGLLKEGEIADGLSSRWQNASRVMKAAASLTDDPLGSQGEMALLPQGSRVRLLGLMGLWAYVEARVGESLLRGFVKDATLAAAGREESLPFDLRAVSWGPLLPDYAVARYFAGETADGLEEGEARRDGGTPMPTVWLRLDSLESRAELETLSHFRVVSGRASCEAKPVPMYVIDNDTGEWIIVHFLPKDGFNRAALELALEPGERVGSLTIACTKAMENGREETLTLSLAGVPEDSGYPAKGAAFTALRYTPFAPAAEQLAEYERYHGKPATLEGVLEELFQPMPHAPARALALPPDTPEYRLFLVEGRMAKEHGPFGVYDVLFSLENPPEGVWLAPYQECDCCAEIDSFDMIGDGVILPDGLWDIPIRQGERMPETLERDFAILVLVRMEGRDGEEIDRLMKGLSIAASFSAEKWNISYEQHLMTTAIGPRSKEQVDMSGIFLGEGILSEIP